MKRNESDRWFARAQKVLPGGVNSPVRAFKSVGMDPVFIKSAHGSRITDVDGNTYIDYICSWGPMILGHSPELLNDGLMDVIMRGTSYGVPSSLEVEMAEEIIEAYPSVEMLRMVSSGTEASMSALRVARAYTGRDKIVKFEGCYHGHSDALLVKSGSGTLTYGTPTSAGVPEGVIQDTLVGRYNDCEQIRELFDTMGDEIAAVIVEPVAGNMGVVAATPAFLETLREVTAKSGAVLIFDEVITGFRMAYGGAREIYGIDPDMACFGKIIGGGLPVGAYGGKREIMAKVAPLGPAYQAGTLSGNPLAMHMGLVTLRYLKAHPEAYTHMEALAVQLEEGFKRIVKKLDIPLEIVRFKGMVCPFFTQGPIVSYDDVSRCDTVKYGAFFRKMLGQGILIPPAQFEGFFLSAVHTHQDIADTLAAAENALREIYS